MAANQVTSHDRTATYAFTTEAKAWPALTGKVVPASVVQIRVRDARVAFHDRRMREALTEDAAAREAEAIVRVNAEFYASHVKQWSLPVPVTAENMLNCLPEETFRALEDVVTGWAGLSEPAD